MKIHFFYLDLGLRSHKMLPKPLYSDTRFKVDTPNGLGGDAFTRKYII